MRAKHFALLVHKIQSTRQVVSRQFAFGHEPARDDDDDENALLEDQRYDVIFQANIKLVDLT